MRGVHGPRVPDDSQPFSVHTYLLLFCVCNSNNYDATKTKKEQISNEILL